MSESECQGVSQRVTNHMHGAGPFSLTENELMLVAVFFLHYGYMETQLDYYIRHLTMRFLWEKFHNRT